MEFCHLSIKELQVKIETTPSETQKYIMSRRLQDLIMERRRQKRERKLERILDHLLKEKERKTHIRRKPKGFTATYATEETLRAQPDETYLRSQLAQDKLNSQLMSRMNSSIQIHQGPKEKVFASPFAFTPDATYASVDFNGIPSGDFRSDRLWR